MVSVSIRMETMPASPSDSVMRDDGSGTADAVRRELGRRGTGLRFSGPLEQAYRDWHARGSQMARIALAGIVIALLAINTLNEFLLLRPEAGFLPLAHVIQWAAECSAAVIALLVHLDRRLQRFWDPVLVVASLVFAFGVEAQRVLELTWGFEMPALFAPIALVAGIMCTRLRFWWAMPMSTGFIVAWGWIEVAYLDNPVMAINVLFAGFVAWSGLLVGLYGQEYQSRRAWLQQEWNRVMSETDPMTLMPNRRALNRISTELTSLAEREHEAVAMAVIDIDHFKRYNDRHGHDRGDECIRRVGQALIGQARRAQDVVSRIGGEEFVIVWYGRRPETLYEAAESCRTAVRDLAIPHPDSGEGVVTVSVGAVCLSDAIRQDMEALYRAADAELYVAKRAGRNRCSVRQFTGEVPIAASEQPAA